MSTVFYPILIREYTRASFDWDLVNKFKFVQTEPKKAVENVINSEHR